VCPNKRLSWPHVRKRALNRPFVPAAVVFDTNFNEYYSLRRKVRLRAKLKDYYHIFHDCVEQHSQRQSVEIYSATSVLARYAVCFFPAYLFHSVLENDHSFYRCVVRGPVCLTRIGGQGAYISTPSGTTAVPLVNRSN
jgi:hypothetical protein